MTCLLAFLVTFAASSTTPSIQEPEFFVRTDPAVSVERLAEAIRPFGRIESRSRGTQCYLIQLKRGVNDESAKQELNRNAGMHVLTAAEEPVDMNSMRSVNRKIRHITDERFDKAESGRNETDMPGLDYLQAYKYMVGRRAFPNDYFDWNSLDQARRHVEQMPVGKLKPLLPEPSSVSNAFWQFMGPTNLQIPPFPSLDFGLPPVNGRVNAVAFDPFHPQTIYAGGAQGGLWRSFDFGTTWTWLSSSWTQLAVNCIVIDPKDSNTIYVGRGDYHGHIAGSYGIMKTTDGGVTWAEIATATMGNIGVDSILIDPTNDQVLVAGTGDPAYYGQLYLSKDAGKTWKSVQGLNQDVEWPTLAASLPGHGATRFYAVRSGKASKSGSGGRLMVSDDHGTTWKTLASPLQDLGTFYYSYAVATSPTSSGNVYVLDAQHQKLYTSANQGAVWKDVSANLPTGSDVRPNYNFSQSDYDYHLECGTRSAGSKATDVLYLGMIDIQESLDGGGSWQTIGGPTWVPLTAVSHNDQHALAVCPSNPNLAIFSNDGGVYSLSYSSNTKQNTVVSLNKTLGNTTFYKIACHPTNPDIVLGGTQDNASPFSNGDLANWINRGAGDGGGCIIKQADPMVGFVTCENLHVWKTADGWATQTEISPPNGKGETVPFVAPLVENPIGSYLIYTGTNIFYFYNDFQNLWYTGPDLTVNKGLISAIAAETGAIIYAGSDDGALSSYDGFGNSWTRLQTPVARAITSISISSSDSSDFLFGYSGTGADHLFRYQHVGGQGYIYQSVSGSGATGLPDASLNAIARDPDAPDTTWYVATDVGVFQTIDAGKTWANIGAPYGLPNVIVNDLVAVPGTRYLNAGTYGRGIWRLYLASGQPSLASIALSPSSLIGGNNASATVTLNAPAIAGGTTVLISGTSNLIVPSSISVPAGATSATFQVLTNSVSADTTETITATQHTISTTASLTLHAAQLTSLKIRPSNVTSGTTAIGEVDLNGNAPSTGMTIALKCNVRGVVIPSSVTIPPDSTYATFSIVTASSQPKTSVTITATKGATVLTDTFTVQPASLQGVTVSPTAAVGGSQTAVEGTLTFSGPFPSGSVVVKLASSSPAAVSVPASITVTPTSSQLTFNFPVTHFQVKANTTAILSATVNGQKLTTTLQVSPFQIVSLTATPSSIAVGGTSIGAIQINAAPNSKTGPLSIALTQTGNGITIPSKVSVPAGQTSATFNIGSAVVTADTQSTLQATLGSSTATVMITVAVTNLVSLTIAPSTFVGGSNVSVVGTVTISSPAPSAGIVVHLMSYDTSGQLTVPSTVTIPAGQTSVSFTVTHHTVPIQEVVQIAATANNQTQTASVTVTT